MEWQPRETAPRDGQQVIVWCADGQAAIAEYYQAPDGFCGWEAGHTAEGKRMILSYPVTHWMPLPPPPGAE